MNDLTKLAKELRNCNGAVNKFEQKLIDVDNEKADKNSCTVILNKTDYVNKVNAMIDEGLSKDKYVETVDSTHNDLKHSQDFIYRHFYKTKYYDGMRPVPNQPARFVATAKRHEFNTI